MDTDHCVEHLHSKPTIPILSPQEIVALAETFKLLGDSSRLRILMRCLQQPAAVNEIAESLGLSQSLVSHHLRLLKAARLVVGERQAKQIFYQVADKHVSHVLLDMAIHLNEEQFPAV